jgi:hypothetical protein
VFEAVLAQQHGEFEHGPVGDFDAGDLHVRVRRRRPPDCAAQTSRIAGGHGRFPDQGAVRHDARRARRVPNLGEGPREDVDGQRDWTDS